MNLWVQQHEGREDIIKALTSAVTKPLIFAGIPRPTEQERATLRELLADAGGDSLNALNLAGVPPLLILNQIQGLEFNDRAFDRASKKLAYELRNICKALGYAAHALETIGPSMQACLHQIFRDRDIHERDILRLKPVDKHIRQSVEKYERYEVPETFTVDHLRVYKLILENRGDFLWLPPKRKKGGQASRLLNGLVLSMYETCLCQLRQRLHGRLRPQEKPNLAYTRIAVRAIDGLISATGCAAFPRVFGLPAVNPAGLTDKSISRILRTVRDTYKKSEPYMANSKARFSRKSLGKVLGETSVFG